MSIEDDLREFVRAEARAVFEEMWGELRSAAPPLPERFYTVSEAAEVTRYKAATIRTWICQRKIKNYGRKGSPRVRLSEILNLNPAR